MTQKIVWDDSGKKFYEIGVDRGVLYVIDVNGTYPKGVAWNGLTTVTEKPAGAGATALYADNIKYANMIAAEIFSATVQAFTYPDEFGVCDGSVAPVIGVNLGQQGRSLFGLCYRTLIGNDVSGNDLGHKLHLLYGCQAAPSEKAFATINDSPSAISFSWEIATTPVPAGIYKPTSYIVIDSTKVNATKLAALETILYGVAEIVADPDATPTPIVGAPAVEGRLPMPSEIITLMTPSA